MIEAMTHAPADIQRSVRKNTVLNTRDYSPRKKEKKLTQESTLADYINYFDHNWQQENLPRDWYNLQGKKSEVGFSMKKQMALLNDPGKPKDVVNWTQQTKQDLIGFKLEYLSDHLVYPCKYQRNSIDPGRLESREYGNKDIAETVSEQERNGSVKNTLNDIKAFFLSTKTPDGSISVMSSPKGDSGLKTDNGKRIEYPDSYFFVMQKTGDTVTNYTIKTDFSAHETREVIYQLTGRRLSREAPLEDYVRAIATIKPGQDRTIHSISDVVRVLETVRPSHAFEDRQMQQMTEWNAVYRDISQAERLYDFNEKTHQMIKDFEEYSLQREYTKDDLQKSIAATILRMSQLFYTEERKEKQITVLKPGTWYEPKRIDPQSFGNILEAVAARPGCAGGGVSSGESVVVSSVTMRLGSVEGNDTVLGEKTLQCKKCPICGATDIVATIIGGRIICPANGCSAPYAC